MLAMVRDPLNNGPLYRCRAQRGERRPQDLRCGEASMCQKAVEADRDAEPDWDVHDPEDREVAPAERAVPQLPSNKREREKRHGGDYPGGNPVREFVRSRLDIAGRRSGWALHCGGLDADIGAAGSSLTRSTGA